MRNGQGFYRHIKGKMILIEVDGSWKNDMMSGECIIRSEEKVIRGLFIEGKLEGQI